MRRHSVRQHTGFLMKLFNQESVLDRLSYRDIFTASAVICFWVERCVLLAFLPAPYTPFGYMYSRSYNGQTNCRSRKGTAVVSIRPILRCDDGHTSFFVMVTAIEFIPT